MNNDSNVCGLSDPCLSSPQCSNGTCVGVEANCTAQGFIPGECQVAVCLSQAGGCQLSNTTGGGCTSENLCLVSPTVGGKTRSFLLRNEGLTVIPAVR